MYMIYVSKLWFGCVEDARKKAQPFVANLGRLRRMVPSASFAK